MAPKRFGFNLVRNFFFFWFDLDCQTFRTLLSLSWNNLINLIRSFAPSIGIWIHIDPLDKLALPFVAEFFFLFRLFVITIFSARWIWRPSSSIVDRFINRYWFNVFYLFDMCLYFVRWVKTSKSSILFLSVFPEFRSFKKMQPIESLSVPIHITLFNFFFFFTVIVIDFGVVLSYDCWWSSSPLAWLAEMHRQLTYHLVASNIRIQTRCY